MQLTTPEAVKSYLQERNLFPEASIVFLDIGNVNYVYEIEEKKEKQYLKFFGDIPRKNTETIQKIGYTLGRFKKEFGSIKFLQDNLSPETKDVIPSITHLDEENRIMIVTDIARGGPVLKELLLTNFNINKVKDVLTQVARFTASQHISTFNRENFLPYFEEDEIFNRRFYDFRTLVSCENLSKELQEAIKKKADEIYKKNETNYSCLIVNDLSPKQIFIRPDNKIGLCDFEIMAKGVASYDVGFFIANINIMRVVRPEYKEELKEVMHHFLDIYFTHLEQNIDNPTFINFTKKHINFFIGTSMLNRIDAVPLEPHIPESKVEEIRNIGVEFIFNQRNF
tara:strand:+ start:467 stop:1483 length:1017 start_codon:yes stop_codon:yes gene_type:complete